MSDIIVINSHAITPTLRLHYNEAMMQPRVLSLFLVIAIVIGVACASGCNRSRLTAKPDTRDLEKSAFFETLEFWQPHLLFLSGQPYSEIYVEVDAVKGCEPSDSELNALHAFLEEFCDKPSGIRIVRGDAIPRTRARGKSFQSLSLENLNGPPRSSNDTQPAFLYVLYFDDRLLPERRETVQPHVALLPYPAATMINGRYVRHFGLFENKSVAAVILRHEAGHLLGLTRNQNHNDGGPHCTHRPCLMQPTVTSSMSRQLLGLPQPGLPASPCEDCRSDLIRSKSQTAPSNLRFMGPVLVRSEEDYHVLSLPHYVKLHIGPLHEMDWQEVVTEARNYAQENPGDTFWARYVASTNIEQLKRAIQRAKTDPYPTVRQIAEELEERTANNGNHEK